MKDVMSRAEVKLAVDVMGADGGLEATVGGCAEAQRQGLEAQLRLFGREADVREAAERFGVKRYEIEGTEGVVEMDDKPTRAMRRKDTSMWGAVAAVKAGTCHGAVSSGNTGALMAVSMLQLRMIEGVERPAITASWPSTKGRSIVLDVGANVEATAQQLVQFAIMGEAYHEALTGEAHPSVGLLNVGEEEAKGHELIRAAAKTLKTADPDMRFVGFVEGDDISMGEVDVVVTDGFTGNIALKAAEGTARMIAAWIKDALTTSIRTKAGALLMGPGLKDLKARMDPARMNGAPLLGLNGLVVKSHGGANADGVASALLIAENLAVHPFKDRIAQTIAEVEARASKHEEAGDGDTDEDGAAGHAAAAE